MGFVSVIPELDGMHVTATNYALDGLPQYACDPSMPLDDVWSEYSWITPTFANTTGITAATNLFINSENTIGNQKFIMDLGGEYVIERVYYENGHSFGYVGTPEYGAKNAILYGSNSSSSLLDVDYSNTSNLTPLWSGILEKHSEINASDPKYITLINSTPYRYYVFRIADNWGSNQKMCIRRMELQYFIDDSSFSSSSSSISLSSSSSSTEIRSSSSSSSSSTEIRSSSSSSSTEIRSSSSSSSSSTEIKTSSSSSSVNCPNTILSLTGAAVYTSGTVTPNTFLSINANGSSLGNYYIELFDGDITGKTYDQNVVFYGHEGVATVTSSNFISIIINGTTYYIQLYSGANQSECCSNLSGVCYNSGRFESRGFIMVRCNYLLKFIEVYEKIV